MALKRWLVLLCIGIVALDPPSARAQQRVSPRDTKPRSAASELHGPNGESTPYGDIEQPIILLLVGLPILIGRRLGIKNHLTAGIHSISNANVLGPHRKRSFRFTLGKHREVVDVLRAAAAVPNRVAGTGKDGA